MTLIASPSRLPPALDRVLPHLDVEGSPPGPEGEVVQVSEVADG
jgi:hypothetical protein